MSPIKCMVNSIWFW